jgi:probable HAF family extracellular repeat protein
MKSLRLTGIIAMTLFALAMPVSLAAQNKTKSDHHHQYHHYQLNDMGTFGGPNSSFVLPSPEVRLLNNSGVAVGSADTPTLDPLCINFNFDCYVSSTFKWQDGVVSNLGALPGSNSSIPGWVNDNGLVTGISENGIDPLTGGPALEAILWGEDGSIDDLGTFGGNDSSANAVNNRDQVAGAALNAIPDPYTGVFLISGATQVHAFRWTKSRALQDLGTLGGTDSAAFFINDRGQIGGWSFTNTTVNSSTGAPTMDPFLWEDGRMVDLGTLGGTFGKSFSLNNRGQVAGSSDLAGDQSCHPFLWDKKGGMRDLGTLGGDSGQAFFVNDAGEVVGAANLPDGVGCDAFTPAHAFLWKNGVMTDLGAPDNDPCSVADAINSRHQIVGFGWDCQDIFIPGYHASLSEDGEPMADLNSLIPPNPGLQLNWAAYVNDPGEIAAIGTFSNGDIHAFVLTPCDENHPGVEGCDYSMVDAATLQQTAPPATQRPAAATPPSRMPAGMLNRFRSRVGQRTLVSGNVRTPVAEQTSSANTGSVDLEGEQLLGPLYGHYKGYCGVSGGKLTGYCTAYSYYSCAAKVSTACPSGKTAIKPGYFQCSNRFSRYVDLGTGCGFN